MQDRRDTPASLDADQLEVGVMAMSDVATAAASVIRSALSIGIHREASEHGLSCMLTREGIHKAVADAIARRAMQIVYEEPSSTRRTPMSETRDMQETVIRIDAIITEMARDVAVYRKRNAILAECLIGCAEILSEYGLVDEVDKIQEAMSRNLRLAQGEEK